MQLANPPLLELGIQFSFDPAPEKETWDTPVAMSFIEHFADEFPSIEILGADEIRIEKRSPEGTPQKVSGRTFLQRVRARNAEGSRWVQVGDDFLVFNLVRHGGSYPGFGEVRDEALAKLDRYVEHFRPICVCSMSLIYIDRVEVPRPPDGVLKLDEYFRLRIDIPDDPFGHVGQFVVGLQFPRTDLADQLTLTFRTEPVTPDSKAYPFVMQWQSECEDVKTLERSEIVRRLDTARARMLTCFAASFTEKGLALFGPKDCE